MNAAQRSLGFTLIELMIAVAIISILAGIAWPAWQNYVTRSHRTAAQACLLEQAQFMERFYTQNMSYNRSRAGANVALPNTSCATSLQDRYRFSIQQVDASSYQVIATPRNVQERRDSECGTLGVDQTGAKTASGSGGATRCW